MKYSLFFKKYWQKCCKLKVFIAIDKGLLNLSYFIACHLKLQMYLMPFDLKRSNGLKSCLLGPEDILEYFFKIICMFDDHH